MAQLFRADFEEGDLSDFDNTTNPTDIAVNGSAAMVGSFGGDFIIDGTQTETYVSIDFTVSTNSLGFRFYIDISSLTMGTNENFYIMYVRTDGMHSGQVNLLFGVLFWNGSNYSYRFRFYDDGGALANIGYNTISDEPHYIEVQMVRETAEGAGDGTAEVKVDGVSGGTLSNIDNFNLFPTIDELQIGARRFLDAGTTGNLYIDDIIFRDDNTEIGEAPAGGISIPVVMQQMNQYDGGSYL